MYQHNSLDVSPIFLIMLLSTFKANSIALLRKILLQNYISLREERKIKHVEAESDTLN